MTRVDQEPISRVEVVESVYSDAERFLKYLCTLEVDQEYIKNLEYNLKKALEGLNPNERLATYCAIHPTTREVIGVVVGIAKADKSVDGIVLVTNPQYPELQAGAALIRHIQNFCDTMSFIAMPHPLKVPDHLDPERKPAEFQQYWERRDKQLVRFYENLGFKVVGYADDDPGLPILEWKREPAKEN